MFTGLVKQVPLSREYFHSSVRKKWWSKKALGSLAKHQMGGDTFCIILLVEV